MAARKKKAQIKNAREVFWSWELGEGHNSTLACWTDGHVVWSYDTVIMVKDRHGNVVLNRAYVTRYTSPYQDSLRQLAIASSYTVVDVWCGAGATVSAILGDDESGMPVTSPDPTTKPEPSAPVKKGPAKLYQFNNELGF